MAKSLTVKIVNAFVSGGTGGNGAGVVLDADSLTDLEMQRIAAAVGLSATAFVSASDTEAFKLDFFTPNSRIAHCGHATVATFSYLAAIGRVAEGNTSKETIEGPRKIVLRDGAAFMEQLAPNYRVEADWADTDVTHAAILKCLGVGVDDLTPKCPPVAVSTGMGFLNVGVRSSAILAGVTPDLDAVLGITEALDLWGSMCSPPTPGHAASARMFAPRYGITG